MDEYLDTTKTFHETLEKVCDVNSTYTGDLLPAIGQLGLYIFTFEMFI